MSELTYKKIIDVEQVETLNDAATVFINDNGAMKQVAAGKFGAVKTVNGTEPDENGNVSTIEPYKVVFINMMGSIMCLHTAEEIAAYASDDNFFNRVLFVHRVKNIANPTAPTSEYISTEIQHGPAAGYCRICFGDEVAPIIIDAEANTITLDPDWVKPEENAGGSGGIPRLFVISEPLDEEPFMKMTPSMTYEELKALLEADNPPILVVKAIYEEEGVQDVALYVQNCSYFIGDGVIKMRADCEMRYTSDGTFEPVPV